MNIENTCTPPAGQPPRPIGLLQDERGLSTVEYIILMVIIVVGCVGIWNRIGASVVGHLEDSEEQIKNIGSGEAN